MARMTSKQEQEVIATYLAPRFHGGIVPPEILSQHRIRYNPEETKYKIFKFDSPTSDGYSDLDGWISTP